MGHPLRRPGAALAALAALAAATAPAGAQQLARDRFALGASDPAPAGDRFYRVESPELLGHGAFDAAVVADFGFSPFVVERPAEGGGREARPVVANQLLLHAGVAATLWDRLKLSANLPMGSTSVAEDVEEPSEPGAAAVLGDLRLAARLRLLGEPGDDLVVSVAGHVWVPTGDPRRFTGEGVPRGSPRLVLGGRAGSWTWGLVTGVALRPEAEASGVTFGPQLLFEAGLVRAVPGLGSIVLEGRVTPVVSGEDAWSRQTTQFDMLFGWRLRAGSFVAGPALAFGKAVGSGAFSLHALLSLAYAPLERPSGGPSWSPPQPPPGAAPGDIDGDGLHDQADRCPYARGPHDNGGCPDADGDGVPDPEDGCPARPGKPGARGCPVHDRDKDGIPDADDSCPDLAGVKSELGREHGCPPDRDSDGVSDLEDACPDKRGHFSLHPDRNGCPRDEKKGR